MLLYKKVFPFDKGMPFSDYINTIRKKHFNNFVLTIDNIPSTENYRAQIFFTVPLWKWGLANAFHEGVLLKECIIQPSKDKRHYALQASAQGWNLFFALFYVIFAILFLFLQFL